MRIEQLETFLAVSDAKSFSKPCGSLYVTQSTVTKRLVSLERELGFELFKRMSTSVETTPEGAIFYDHAKEAVDAVTAGVRAVEACPQIAAIAGVRVVGSIYDVATGAVEFLEG